MPASGLQEGKRALDVGTDERSRISYGIIIMGFRGKMHYRIGFTNKAIH